MKKGILITVLVIVIIFVFLALVGGYIYMQFNREPYVPENALLRIEMSGAIDEIDNSALSKNLTIRDIWYHVGRAKVDPRIKGIVVRVSPLRTGFAKVEEIGRILKDFRQSGKKVYAIIEAGDLREYYLASFADKVYLFKGGYLLLKGLASEAMFLKNTLGRIGVRAEFLHIGDYKTAANMFTEEGMTPAHKESLAKLLDDIYAATLEGIAANRDLEVDAVKQLVEESPISKQAYLDAKFLDGIAYEDQMLDENNLDYNVVSFDIYKDTTSPLPYQGMKKVAVIFASGEIQLGKSGGSSLFSGDVMGSDTVADQLKRARRNRFVKAVVLRVDSPGGSAVASDVIRREAELLLKEKPLVISMSDLAASGGYWIAMSSSKVMALPQTITGSIGVLAGKFILKDLYENIGLNKEVVKTSKYADMFSDYRGFNEEERTKMATMMQSMYKEFLDIVAQSRGMKPEEVDRVAQGRVWAGNTALKLNLVDSLGGLNEAINEAKSLAGMAAEESHGVVVYPRKKSTLDVIMDFLNTKAVTTAPEIVMSLKEQVDRYRSFFPAYMMPYRIAVH